MIARRRKRRTLAAALVVGLLLAAGCVGPFGAPSTSTPAPTAMEPDDGTPTAEPTDESTSTSTPTEVHSDYDRTTVTVVDGETGEGLGRVKAAIADNSSLRYTGLSETDDLPDDRGMLFTYDSERELTYVMRNMSFPLDIVFVHANGTIDSIHERPAPKAGENGESIRASGEGQYVLEVNRGWTDERGVEPGDRVGFDVPE